MDPLIITVALTGNVPTKAMNPNTPVTSEEMAADVVKCAAEGAQLFHVHSRDENQKPTLDIEVYKKTSRLIKQQAPDVIVQLSTGARAGTDFDLRCGPVTLVPEMGSFTTGSNNMPGVVYANHPDFINQLAKTFMDTGVKPEIEVFDSGMITNAEFLVKKGKLQMPLHFNFVMGVPGAQPGTVRQLCHLVDSLPRGCTWCVSGIGKTEIPLAAAAIVMGGHVRCGLEDNLKMPDGSLASNVELVKKVVAIAKEIGRPLATVDEARKILSLDPARKDLILEHIKE